MLTWDTFCIISNNMLSCFLLSSLLFWHWHIFWFESCCSWVLSVFWESYLKQYCTVFFILKLSFQNPSEILLTYIQLNLESPDDLELHYTTCSVSITHGRTCTTALWQHITQQHQHLCLAKRKRKTGRSAEETKEGPGPRKQVRKRERLHEQGTSQG